MSLGIAIDVPSWIDRQKVSSFQIGVVAICGVAVFLDGFDSQIIGFVAPAIIQDLKVAPAALAKVFSSGLIGVLVGCLALAPLADWLGRRWVMITSVLLFAAATFLTSRANSLDELALLRFATGIGLGACMPNALALTAEYAPARLRSTLTAWMFTGFSLGAFLGGLLASQLIPLYGWRAMFMIGGALPFVLGILMIFIMPESVRYLAARGGDASHISSILTRIARDASVGPGARFEMSEVTGTGFTVAHLFRQGRGPGSLLRWARFFLMLFDVFLLASWTPTVLNVSGLSMQASLVTTAVQQLGSVLATIALGPLFDRFGFYRCLVPVLLAAAVGVILMGVAGQHIPLMEAGALLSGAGIMGGQTSLIVLAGAFYPTFIRATGGGWGLGVGRIGAIMGPLVGGAMVAAHWRPDQIFLIAAIPPIIVAGLLLVMSRLAPINSQNRPINQLRSETSAS